MRSGAPRLCPGRQGPQRRAVPRCLNARMGQPRRWRGTLDARRAARVHRHAQLRKRFYDPRGGNVQPPAYALGLEDAAEASGARPHGETRVLRVERERRGWVCTTRDGSVKAEHLVIATNGHTDDLWPGLARTVVCATSLARFTLEWAHAEQEKTAQDIESGTVPFRSNDSI
ncbi:MAG: FAD-dependent oxidoreductase [Pseudomonadota bacterium]